MHSLTTAFAKLHFYATALLVLPLLLSSAAATPTDTHPLAKRQTVAAARPKPTLSSASSKQKVATTRVAAPVASALAAPATPAAPQIAQVKGIVLTANGRPCAGASVYPAGAPRQLVVTDAQGAFTLPVPAGEPVSLRVEYFGEGSSRVEVPTPGTEPLRITLGK